MAWRLSRRGGSSRGADAQPRRARRGRRPVPSALRPGSTLRSVAGVAAHRSVPHEAPLRAEWHTARRAVHEHRARDREPPATTRCCSATRTRVPIHARSPPTTRGCVPMKACCPGTGPSSTSPSTSRRGASGCGPAATTCPTTSVVCTTPYRMRRAPPWRTPPSTPKPHSSRVSSSTTSTRSTGRGSRTSRTSGRTPPSWRRSPTPPCTTRPRSPSLSGTRAWRKNRRNTRSWRGRSPSRACAWAKTRTSCAGRGPPTTG